MIDTSTASAPAERSRLRQGITVAGVHLRVAALNELQYRSNFFLQLLQSAFHVVNALVVVALVFSKTPELNGWTRADCSPPSACSR